MSNNNTSPTTSNAGKKAKSAAADDHHDHAGLTKADRNALSDFFRKSTVSDIIKTSEKPLVTVNETDTMRVALETLNTNKISSAPVRFVPTAQEQAKSHNYNPIRFRGMIDTMDIMMFLAETYAKNKRQHDHLFNPKELEAAFDTPISVYINESGRDPFIAVDSKMTVYDLMENFFNWGVRRVPVAVDGVISATISQSDVVKFIYDNLSKLGPLGQRKMLDLHLIGTHHSTDGGELRDDESSIPKLVSVLDNATVLEAVQLMTKHKISAVGICDISGKLVGNFSASDLKGITPTKLFELESKLVDVLIYNNTYREPISCSVDAALRIALKKIVEGRAHRIYIVDSITHRARGVVTLTDLIRGIVGEFTHNDNLGDDDE